MGPRLSERSTASFFRLSSRSSDARANVDSSPAFIFIRNTRIVFITKYFHGFYFVFVAAPRAREPSLASTNGLHPAFEQRSARSSARFRRHG